MCALSQAARRAFDLFAGRAGKLLVGENDEARLQGVVAGDEPRDRLALPAQEAVEREHDSASPARRQALGAFGDRGGQRLLRGVAQRLRVGAFGLRVGGEAEAVQRADVMAFHQARRRRA